MIAPSYLPGYKRHSDGFCATYFDGHAKWHKIYGLAWRNFDPAAP